MLLKRILLFLSDPHVILGYWHGVTHLSKKSPLQPLKDSRVFWKEEDWKFNSSFCQVIFSEFMIFTDRLRFCSKWLTLKIFHFKFKGWNQCYHHPVLKFPHFFHASLQTKTAGISKLMMVRLILSFKLKIKYLYLIPILILAFSLIDIDCKFSMCSPHLALKNGTIHVFRSLCSSMSGL